MSQTGCQGVVAVVMGMEAMDTITAMGPVMMGMTMGQQTLG